MDDDTIAREKQDRVRSFWRIVSMCCDFGRRFSLFASAVCAVTPIVSHFVSPPTDFNHGMAPLIVCAQGLSLYLLCAALFYSTGEVAKAVGLPNGFEGKWTVLARRIRMLAAALLVVALVEAAFSAALMATASLQLVQFKPVTFLSAFPSFRLWFSAFSIGDGQGEMEALKSAGMVMPIDAAALFSSLSILVVSLVFDTKSRVQW